MTAIRATANMGAPNGKARGWPFCATARSHKRVKSCGAIIRPTAPMADMTPMASRRQVKWSRSWDKFRLFDSASPRDRPSCTARSTKRVSSTVFPPAEGPGLKTSRAGSSFAAISGPAACPNAQGQQACDQARASLGYGPRRVGHAGQQVCDTDIQPFAKELNQFACQHGPTEPRQSMSRSEAPCL